MWLGRKIDSPVLWGILTLRFVFHESERPDNDTVKNGDVDWTVIAPCYLVLLSRGFPVPMTACLTCSVRISYSGFCDLISAQLFGTKCLSSLSAHTITLPCSSASV